MKKFLSVLLCLAMVLSVAVPAVLAQKDDSATGVFKEGEYPILFVTGIGQSFTYYLDEESDKTMTVNGEEYNYTTKHNLFIFDKDRALSSLLDHSVATNAAIILAQLIKTYVLNSYSVDYSRLCQLAKDLLGENIIDESGNLPEQLFTARYNCPISEYPDVNGDYGKQRFYASVRARDIIEEFGEEKVFCFNFAPFGNLSKVSKDLDAYINDVVFKYYPDAEKVVLVPMSMGAAMVSQYLYDYSDKNQVARVVSIVGCWNGSDIMADLIEGKFVENSSELFYNELVPYFMDNGFWANIINVALHLFHKENLSTLISEILSAVCDELMLKTPTLLALIPSYRYEAIREKYLTRPGYEGVLEQLDEYHDVQITLKDRMEKLNKEQGVDFYFISGYNLAYGEVANSSEYALFRFLYSSNKVNSDEIINIESTAPGATSVPADTEFSEEYLAKANSKYIAPNKSVDLSSCYYPDRCWLFNKQKHELENNNTAIKLALKIARGQITSINDCPETFPQFNDSRNVKGLRSDVEFFESYIEANKDNPALAENVEACKKAIERANALMDRTINDKEKDDIEIAEIHKIIETYNLRPIQEEEKSFGDKLNEFLAGKSEIAEKLNDWVYSKFGPKGFFD